MTLDQINEMRGLAVEVQRWVQRVGADDATLADVVGVPVENIRRLAVLAALAANIVEAVAHMRGE